MTRDEFVEKIVSAVEQHLPAALGQLTMEDRFRLAGLERYVRDAVAGFRDGLWQRIMERLAAEAESRARLCGCGKRREARSKPVEVKVLGTTVTIPCTYYYCRQCRIGLSPVRTWLGVEDGDTSLNFERALTDLTERMTFGDAVNSLEEQQGQEIDRTQAERVTYRVADQAEVFLAERRMQATEKLAAEGRSQGVPQLQLTADGGAVPVGELTRPAESASNADTPRTPVRKLLKGTRAIQGREARLIVVREPSKVTERIVDCHIAPYNQTEFSGQRMLAAAAMSGLGDQTQIHGVFDMGTWIHTQFEAQFNVYPHTACADICHVTSYLTDAGRQLVGPDRAERFGMQQKDKLLDGQLGPVRTRLNRHNCDNQCLRTERGDCVVHAAQRYIDNHKRYLDYPPILAKDLPVGSGEAESGIRHLIKKRLDVAGAWREDNAKRMLALVSVRASGLWDDFWRWRDQQDRRDWQRRQRGELRTRFRGSPRLPLRVPLEQGASTAAA